LNLIGVRAHLSTEMTETADIAAERAMDELLVLSAQLGDRASFERLATRWNPRLTAHARRLLGEAEPARDAVQAAWVEMVRGLKGLRDPAAFPAWAYRIVTRRCAAVIGGRRRDRALAVDAAREAAIVVEDAPARDAADDHARLRAAVRALPPDQRATVALHHFEGLSVAETAVALDVPAGTVKTRLMHARRKLRTTLEGDIHD
jgi:RNA polymerase sigma-70 factor (ECF subfamily)